ncbi:Abi-alpha family protein [Nocardioides sp. SYSU D00038]|uniref:Abi-alpha family protein n=1 Tax=Nocardioides sp. SYSU D00038 TaxID=2812554 RepID=UPI0019688F1C|nr:Abi-alpha family protein [Nocardioides sp. SYSU D00038]
MAVAPGAGSGDETPRPRVTDQGYDDGLDGIELPEIPGYPERPRVQIPTELDPVVEALPGLARVAASAAWHTTEWGVRTYARTWLRVARAVADPEEASALARDATQAAAVVGDLARSVSQGTPIAKALTSAGLALGELADPPTVSGSVVHHHHRRPTLRERGADLLERSRDVWNDDAGHPAFDRILDELAPDEGRILLLLLQGGPQPTVDVRTGGPVGLVNSQLIAPGLSMIGARAGCRHTDQVPAYLNNLFRLGLVWFSRESLRDPLAYQVVEAQPDVLAAMHSVKFAKVVRRSIHLTPFGEDFCRAVLVEEDAAAHPFPEHAKPPAGEDSAEPPSER